MKPHETQVALHAFMPYGAPDLLACERTHLARALFAGSFLVTVALLAAFAVSVRLTGRPLELPVPTPFIHDLAPDLLPPPALEPAPPIPIAPAPAAAARTGGDVVPVDDAHADPVATVPSQTELQSAPSAPSTATGPGIVAPPAEEALPAPGEFRYADEYPTLVIGVQPEYPPMAREAGVEGTVVVLALVGKDGHVMRTQLAPGGSVVLLDEVALDAVRRFVFTPALSNRHPVVVWVRVPVAFHLH